MSDAEKREKVIFAIENCLTTDSVTECRKTECPFISCRESCLEWLLRSALALLKEQEPRVMMKEEIVLCTDWVWCEYTSGYQGWYKMEEYDTDYNLIRWEDTTTDIVDDYGFRWRVWTFRPTEEERKNVPWEVDNNA